MKTSISKLKQFFIFLLCTISIVEIQSCKEDPPKPIMEPEVIKFNLEISKHFGGSEKDFVSGCVETNDGCLIVVGESSSSNHDLSSNYGIKDGWVAKINSNGDIIWSNNFGGSSLDELYNVIATNDGNYIACGMSSSDDIDLNNNHHLFDGWIIKFDGNGNILWSKNYGGTSTERIYSIVELQDGTLVAAGNAHSQDIDLNIPTYGGTDGWVLKLESNGNIIWSKAYGGTKNDSFLKIKKTNDNSLIMCGNTFSADNDLTSNYGSTDAWVVKINENGDKIWSFNFGGSDSDSFIDFQITAQNEIILCGESESNDQDLSNGNYGQDDAWITKINSSGSMIWSKNFGGSQSDVFSSIVLKPNNNILICGFTESNDHDLIDLNIGLSDGWLVELDENGDNPWFKNLGGSLEDELISIVSSSNNNYYSIGFSFSSDLDLSSGNYGNSDFWFTKIKK